MVSIGPPPKPPWRSSLSLRSRCSSLSSKSIGYGPEGFPKAIHIRSPHGALAECGSARPGFRCASSGLQPQDRLGDDVLLDLVRAAVDRDLAHVEVARRERRRPLGSDRRLVPAFVLEIFG